MGVDQITAIADKGYYSASEFAKCKEDNIIPIVSKADHSHMAATIGFGKSQFKYDEENDGIYVHREAFLKPCKTRKANAKYVDHKRYTNPEACTDCPVKDQCTINKDGRTIHDRPSAIQAPASNFLRRIFYRNSYDFIPGVMDTRGSACYNKGTQI